MTATPGELFIGACCMAGAIVIVAVAIAIAVSVLRHAFRRIPPESQPQEHSGAE